MNNQPCIVRMALVNLNPNEIHYCPLMVSLGRCDGCCNTVEDLFGRICIPNKREDKLESNQYNERNDE